VSLEKLRGRLILSVIFGAVVFIGISAYGDFGDVADSLGEFRWELLPLVLVLSFSNYILRFFKWQYYLKLIGVTGLAVWQSALIYLSGLGMAVTPGKVGEWLKSYLLREIHGTPMSRSAPIILAERLTDSLGLVVLGAGGLLVYGDAWPAFVAFLLIGLVVFIVARHEPSAYWVLRRIEQFKPTARFAEQAEEFYKSSFVLFAPVPFLSMTLLSAVSWGFEVLGFYFVLIGLGQDPSWDLLLKASFIMPAATLASALLLTPGGLGVAEGGIVGLSQVLLDLPKGPAAVGALVIRFGTLWFGVIVGIVALVLVTRSMSTPLANTPGPGEGAPAG
jgi:uncharacterized protein (TIRG00374 family)